MQGGLQIGRIFDIAAAIVGVALVAVVVTSPGTAPVVTAFGNSFAGSLRAAMGR